jgi:nitroimidazol reductase NimA-like FMN-containing flavoprotein (pyridoxamine 5'-phosphate oxidase superfamily)
MTPEETESLLREAKIARFCTLNKDGTIHAAPVWYKYENGQVILATPVGSRKARNIKRNRNVTILFNISEGGVQPRCGLIYGRQRCNLGTKSDSVKVSLFSRDTCREKMPSPMPEACSS